MGSCLVMRLMSDLFDQHSWPYVSGESLGQNHSGLLLYRSVGGPRPEEPELLPRRL